jgi:hypothetical protein
VPSRVHALALQTDRPFCFWLKTLGRRTAGWQQPDGRRSGYEVIQLKGLILAQNERWRRGLGMQVARVPAMGKRRKGQ